MKEFQLLNDFKNIIINKNFNLRDKELYYDSFKEVLKKFKENISVQKYNEVLMKINMINKEKDDEQIYRYYQFITEIVVGNYLLERFGNTFKSEVRLVNGKKTDVDYQIEFNNIIYNIEVKCPSYKVKDIYNSGTEYLKVSFLSRGKTKEEYNNYLKDIENDIIKPILEKGNYKGGNRGKLEDDKIKDFLISGQSKFPECKDNNKRHLNILMIGLDSPMDIVEWYKYFTNPLTGFFNTNSYLPHKEFYKVDMVILSNLISGHRDLKKIDGFNCWGLENYFNYFLVNPFSFKNKELNKENMYKLYEQFKQDSISNKPGNINQSKVILMLMSKIYNDYPRLIGITEKEMISEVVDYIYDEPIIYNCLIEEIHYFKVMKKIGDSDLNEAYSYVNDIIPNQTLEFNLFRSKVVEFNEENNTTYKYTLEIYDQLFNDYIWSKYDILVDKT